MICNCLRGTVTVPRITRPGIDVDNHRFAVFLNNCIATKNLQPQSDCSAECFLAQPRDIEGMPKHSLVAMIELVEPVASHRRRVASDTVKFDEIARHVLLRDNEWNVTPGKPVQSLTPSCFRRNVDDIGGLRRVKIITLHPNGGWWRWPLRIGRDDVAGRCRDTMPRKKLDHPVAVGVT